MDGVVTVLDPQNYAKVLSIWQELRVLCDVPEIKNLFLPHFSWHVSASYDCDRLNEFLKELGGRSQSFTAHTGGLGIFPGEKPVVYIPVVKDRALMDFHELLWTAITPLADEPSPLYSPLKWMPHITIFFDELYDPLPAGFRVRDKLGCVIDSLIEQDLIWTLKVENIAYGCMGSDQMSFNHYQFGE